MILKLTTEQLDLIKKGYWVITKDRLQKGDKVYIDNELCGIIDIVERSIYFFFESYEMVKKLNVNTLDLITKIEKESMYSSSDIRLTKIEQFIWFKEPEKETILAIAKPEKKTKKVKDNE